MKAYVQKHFSCSEEVKRVNLKNNYYEEDNAEEGQLAMEQITLDTLQNEKGLRKRATFIAESKDVMVAVFMLHLSLELGAFSWRVD